MSTVNQLNEQQLAEVTAKLANVIKPGARLTVFNMNALAMTSKTETLIRTVIPPMFRPHYQTATHGEYRIGTFTEGRKRKEYYLNLDGATLIFEGWGLPIKTDLEATNRCAGNACLNLCAGSVEEIKDWIENKNLNPLFKQLDAVIFVQKGVGEYDDNIETLVYPNVPTSHAVVQGLRDAILTATAQITSNCDGSIPQMRKLL